MPIKVLPLQLVNHIAAGEIVERPASVVKELVENSLDAGATNIAIDIERGGTKMIRIRDNAGGISKDELVLALASHTTSKITCIQDLECITSMGFRGEALASVSSVSRLTLTSCTKNQNGAWQVAYTDGMVVTIQPAAHPVGTTVEVRDLFYNTPARRKFMRPEQTEFANIDEVIRRLALARFDVTFILQHNAKMVRQYICQPSQNLRRLSRICGSAFIDRALTVSWQHGDLAISGWIVVNTTSSYVPEIQYSYVNKRIVRDKIINHAIRQAYQEQQAELPPAFVLFLDIDPHQVDVNVHPAKHEVRFHKARLVHDFIYQTVITVLQQHATTSGKPPPAAYRRTQLPRSIEAKAKKLADSNDHDSVFGRILTIYPPCYALIESPGQLSLLSLAVAERYITECKLTPGSDTMRVQPLLIPLRIILSDKEATAFQRYHTLLQKIGIVLQPSYPPQVILTAVPLLVRQHDLPKLIADILGYLHEVEEEEAETSIARWLACWLNRNRQSTSWNHSRAIQLLSEIERLCPQLVTTQPDKLIVKLNLEDAIKALV